jgi:hypothetical protein
MSQPRMEAVETPGADEEAAIPKLDLTRLIDSSGLGSVQIGVVALCACVVMLDGFDVQTITYVAPALTKDLGIERSMLGPVFSAGLFGTTLGAFAFGVWRIASAARRCSSPAWRCSPSARSPPQGSPPFRSC